MNEEEEQEFNILDFNAIACQLAALVIMAIVVLILVS